MLEPKILILVLAIDKDPWKKIEIEGQVPTWRTSSTRNVTILRYIGIDPKNSVWKFLDKLWIVNQKIRAVSRGRLSFFSINFAVKKKIFFNEKIEISKDQIVTTVPDLYSLIGAKTLDAFAVSIQKFDYDYIYRTNVSSYIDIEGLQNFVIDKPRNNFYAGAIGNHQGVNFASGCGYFVSRDLISKVLNNQNLWDHNLIDDVSLGKILTKEFKIKIQEVNRIDLNSSVIDLDQITENSLNVFHYRCKAAKPEITIQIMNFLHRVLYNR